MWVLVYVDKLLYVVEASVNIIKIDKVIYDGNPAITTFLENSNPILGQSLSKRPFV